MIEWLSKRIDSPRAHRLKHSSCSNVSGGSSCLMALLSFKRDHDGTRITCACYFAAQGSFFGYQRTVTNNACCSFACQADAILDLQHYRSVGPSNSSSLCSRMLRGPTSWSV